MMSSNALNKKYISQTGQKLHENYKFDVFGSIGQFMPYQKRKKIVKNFYKDCDLKTSRPFCVCKELSTTSEKGGKRKKLKGPGTRS